MKAGITGKNLTNKKNRDEYKRQLESKQRLGEQEENKIQIEPELLADQVAKQIKQRKADVLVNADSPAETLVQGKHQVDRLFIVKTGEIVIPDADALQGQLQGKLGIFADCSGLPAVFDQPGAKNIAGTAERDRQTKQLPRIIVKPG